MILNLTDLISKEGWEIRGRGTDARIIAFDQEYPITHPVQIYLKRYREEKIADLKYQYMRAAHDYLWPKDVPTWHSWTEDRFKEHCVGWNFMTWAGCASSTKSYDAAKIALLFWLANPQNRAVMVASTTLTAMGRRVWGYTTRLLNQMAVPLPFQYYSGNSPQILYPQADRTKAKDTLHGIIAAAAKQGSDETAISNFIGSHPRDAMMLILDECTDLPVAILGAVANLKSTEKPFQLIGIGNSSDMYDLHGSLATPEDGWSSINPYSATKWRTTQKNGICLYFNAYNSPAIHEKDPDKKKLLSAFLPTESTVREAENTYGKDSIQFWRFTLGFWRPSTVSDMMMTKEFVAPKRLYEKAHWLGLEPLIVVAGLDPAFSSGGDKCILRLGYLGQTVDGDVVLDFRGHDLLFDLPISASSGDAAEIQISKQVTDILNKYGCPIHHLVIDASGQGRALGGTIQLYSKSVRPPIKIYNVRTGNQKDKSFDVVPKTRHELWFDIRKFVESGNIRGVDSIALGQITNRLVIRNEKTGKMELESKADYKKRMGAIMPSMAHSPDEADALSLCLQAAIINFGFYPGQRREVPAVQPGALQEIAMWKQGVKTVQENHMKGEVAGYPTADFSSIGIKPWGAI